MDTKEITRELQAEELTARLDVLEVEDTAGDVVQLTLIDDDVVVAHCHGDGL